MTENDDNILSLICASCGAEFASRPEDRKAAGLKPSDIKRCQHCNRNLKCFHEAVNLAAEYLGVDADALKEALKGEGWTVARSESFFSDLTASWLELTLKEHNLLPVGRKAEQALRILHRKTLHTDTQQ